MPKLTIGHDPEQVQSMFQRTLLIYSYLAFSHSSVTGIIKGPYFIRIILLVISYWYAYCTEVADLVACPPLSYQRHCHRPVGVKS